MNIDEQHSKDRIILGIDPGSRITGFGIITQAKNAFRYLSSGCIRTQANTLSERLLEIFDGLGQIITQYRPTEVAIEAVFMHQNPNSALKLGHARGAAMLAVARHDLTISEYAPRAVKQAVVGNGAAGKDQVKHMVMQLLMLRKAPQTDAADALAIAMCHGFRSAIFVSAMEKRGCIRS
ncbi:MAG: crossover junction endodeoxyribonuclease RuvC [Legionella sp.]|nr:crossover junction endodeoxyribonuclease RuvC [Legionella sp.]